MTSGHREDGSVLLWLLAVLLLVVCLGGLSLDLWRGFTARQALAGVVDAASVAGASALDEEAFRRRGSLRLHPDLAEARAWQRLRAGAPEISMTAATVVATEGEIVVRARGTVRLTLLRVLFPARPFLPVTASARATAVERYHPQARRAAPTFPPGGHLRSLS